MRLADLEKWLETNGWHLERQRGSHRHYRHAASGHRVTVSAHGSQLQPHEIDRFLHDLRKLGHLGTTATAETEATGA